MNKNYGEELEIFEGEKVFIEPNTEYGENMFNISMPTKLFKDTDSFPEDEDGDENGMVTTGGDLQNLVYTIVELHNHLCK